MSTRISLSLSHIFHPYKCYEVIETWMWVPLKINRNAIVKLTWQVSTKMTKYTCLFSSWLFVKILLSSIFINNSKYVIQQPWNSPQQRWYNPWVKHLPFDNHSCVFSYLKIIIEMSYQIQSMITIKTKPTCTSLIGNLSVSIYMLLIIYMTSEWNTFRYMK